MSHAWRALRHRNFKLFFAGQSISLIGNWMMGLLPARNMTLTSDEP
jgi:hypothetical protein